MKHEDQGVLPLVFMLQWPVVAIVKDRHRTNNGLLNVHGQSPEADHGTDHGSLIQVLRHECGMRPIAGKPVRVACESSLQSVALRSKVSVVLGDDHQQVLFPNPLAPNVGPIAGVVLKRKSRLPNNQELHLVGCQLVELDMYHDREAVVKPHP